MTKEEKLFRKEFKEIFYDYRDTITYAFDDKEELLKCRCRLFLMENLAEKIFPNIDIERCENRWRKEYKKTYITIE